MISTMIRTKTLNDTYDLIQAKSNVKLFLSTDLRRDLFNKAEIYLQVVEDISQYDQYNNQD